MKKVILTLAFVASIATLNANINSSEVIIASCHAEACQYLAFVEDIFGGEMSESEANMHYNVGYASCMG
ncbi:MAG: hypothetical protein V3V28_07125 [Polaribacter sp.]|uniref:hypothetical protein n=1 Tax=Polaribacter sp. TaxID=1920175 RepID=UPI002F356E4E